MARRKKGELAPVFRVDLLAHRMNSAKEAVVLDMLRHWQRGALALSVEQWRLFFETGRFDKNSLDKSLTYVVGAANRLQMCRWHVVGQLRSWVGNRANEFVTCVLRSSLSDGTKHMLLVVNACEAWFSRTELMIKETSSFIPSDVRKLARSIMRHCIARHRRPDLSRTNMVLDQRVATLAPATKTSTFPFWLRLSTMASGRRIEVPLLSYTHHEKRAGKRVPTVQINRDRDGTLRVGVITDIAQTCQKAKADYLPMREQLALDFGLSTLLATDDGGLFGQGWLKALRRYDARITTIARHVQRSGGKPRDSRRYRNAVTALRGFIRSEIGRLMNLLAQTKRPARFVVERVDFRSPDMSSRMNRLLQNCGRKIFRDKLTDLEQRLGIRSEEINPAYTSQQCSLCGYVDKRNRPSQAQFRCLWCGHEKHADVNASCNVGQRRSLSIGSVWVKKAAVLGELVARFCARWPLPRGATGCRGAPSDPRWSNPYFRDWAGAARLPPVVRRAKSDATQPL
jgi:putative transposase